MNTSTTDDARIVLGGGFRLPASSSKTLGGGVPVPPAAPVNFKITLGGGFRLPPATPVNGKITLGGGFRLPVAR
jgi:hypothetical protein